MADLADFQMRRLSRADGDAFRAIRLEGLEKHPAAFSASLQEESGHPPAWFADRVEGNFVLGMENQGRLVGVAGFYIQGSEKTRHRGTLWGMYVREEARGKGVARRLVEGILAHARQHVEEVALSVWDENPAAIACYQSAGFSVTGLDARALKIDGAYFDHLLMNVRFAGS